MTKRSTFNDMPLSDGMKKTISEIGFTEPTPIQEKSIPELLAGRDLLGQAQTGTGKTASFAIPLIEKVNIDSKDIQALVVCPTRELCLQVSQEIKRLATHTKGVSVAALYGGQAIDQQFRALKTQRPQIIVATPGRLFDHLRRGSINLSAVFMITLDEADEMLDMGFRDEIEQIFDLLPEENQRIFFSATMPKAIMDLVHSYLRDPVIIKTESKNLTVAKIDQSYFRVRGKEKTELLCRVLDYRDPKLAVVFCNAKSTADEIVDEIKHRGFEAGVLHGDLSQNQRDRVMAQFRAGQVRVLVATDIAARGIDVDDIELVINYHLPHDPEDYVHRIGRTGRAGRKGRAVSLVEPRDNSRLRKITQFARTEIVEEEPPTINDVKLAKLSNLFGKVKTALDSEMIAEYRSFLAKQNLSAEDVAAGLIKLALEKFDEHSMDDAAFLDMRGKKYSGMPQERRRDGREGRGGDRGGERGGDRGGRFGGPRRFEGRGDGRRDDARPDRGGRDFSPSAPRDSFRDRPRQFGAGGSQEVFAKPRKNFSDDRKSDRSEKRPAPAGGGRPYERDVRVAGRDEARKFDGPREDRKPSRFGGNSERPKTGFAGPRPKSGGPKAGGRPFGGGGARRK